jgi:hypothetical protein
VEYNECVDQHNVMHYYSCTLYCTGMSALPASPKVRPRHNNETESESKTQKNYIKTEFTFMKPIN